MLMYANAAIMNPIRFLCIQKYAKLPVSSLTTRGGKRTSALEMLPPSLLLEVPCMGLGCWYAAKLSAPAKSWQLLLCGKERRYSQGDSEVALAHFTRLRWFRGTIVQSQQRNRDLQSVITCFVVSGARIHFYYRITEQPKLEGTSTDMVQPFVGKGDYYLAPWDWPILKTSSDEDSTTSLGRLFQWMVVLTAKKFLSSVKVRLLLSLGTGNQCMTNLCHSFWVFSMYFLSMTVNRLCCARRLEGRLLAQSWMRQFQTSWQRGCNSLKKLYFRGSWIFMMRWFLLINVSVVSVNQLILWRVLISSSVARN